MSNEIFDIFVKEMCDTDIFKNEIKKNVEEVLTNDMINHIDVIDNITSIKETACKLNKISNEYKTNLDELKAKIENYNKYKWHNSYFPFLFCGISYALYRLYKKN